MQSHTITTALLFAAAAMFAACDQPKTFDAPIAKQEIGSSDLPLAASLCGEPQGTRESHAVAGRWCYVDCFDTAASDDDLAACWCTCERTIEECHAEWTNDTCAQGWDHWCHLAIASAGEDCEADCNAASLACLEDDATCGGGCFAAAVECRAACG